MHGCVGDGVCNVVADVMCDVVCDDVIGGEGTGSFLLTVQK